MYRRPPKTSFCFDCTLKQYKRLPDGGGYCHKQCKSSRRFVKEQARSKGRAREIEEYEANNPAEFGARCHDLQCDLVANGYKQRRSNKHRQIAAAMINEIIEYTKVATVQEHLYFGEKAFQSWFVREEGYTIEEAKKKWTDTMDDPRAKSRLHHGVRKYLVYGHLKDVHERGRTNQQRTT